MFGIDDAIGVGAGLIGMFAGGGGGGREDSVLRQQLDVLRQSQDFYKSIDFKALKAKEADYITKGNAHDANLALKNYRSNLAQQGMDPGAYDTALTQGAAQTAYNSAVDGNQKLAGLDAKYLNLQKSLMPNAGDYNGALQASAQLDALDAQGAQNFGKGIASIGGIVSDSIRKKGAVSTRDPGMSIPSSQIRPMQETMAQGVTYQPPSTRSYSIEDALGGAGQTPKISLSDVMRRFNQPRGLFGR